MKFVGELSHVCSQIVLKCLYLARIGRPDILWSVHKLARSITKWTKACDKRLNRLISYIHHTCEYKQYCHVGNTAKQCGLGLFPDSDFARDLEDSKSTSGGTLCVFGSHTLVPISWMCKKQTAVSHSSTESEIISLDTGLRLDGLPALELRDLIVSVLGNISRVSDRSGKPETTSWDILQKVAPHREELLLGGNAHSARYGETIHNGSVKPEIVNHQEDANSENFVMGSDAEFVDKVKDQVRNRQKRMSNVAESGEEHSKIWGMFMAATLNAATFMGKNFSTIQSFVKNYEDLTLKQMFDVTAQLVNNQDEINGLDKILWDKNSWKRLSLVGDETVINLQSTKVYVFSDSVLCLGKVLQHPDSNEA